jgi:hypothetical protein
MADIQRQFEQFHATIRIDYDMSKELREKRDIVLARTKKYLENNDKPTCRELLQGSYKMKTGVKPIKDLEYDIDIGLRFDIRESDYKADEVRGWIYEAVKDHTKRIEDKGPCVRVVYEAGYHLDLVTYAVWSDDSGSEQYRLAHKKNGWRPANPPELIEYVRNYRKQNFEDTADGTTKTDQFRRCVRALRRWNDVQMPYESNSKPTGLAFVLLAIQRELVKSTFLDGRPDDRRSLAILARSIANTLGRVTAVKPTPEYEEMFARSSEADMTDFKGRMGTLAEALEFAGNTADPVKACEKLVEVFGDDFPVPENEDTGKRTKAPAIVTSSSSA